MRPRLSLFASWGRKLLARSTLPRRLQRAWGGDRLTIVMYHAVVRSPLPVADWCFLDEAAFRRQVAYLRRHFDVLALSEAVARLERGEIRSPAAAITFDDGFQNNHDVAFPILREAGLPATIFLTTGLVGTDDTVWYCRLNRALAGTTRTRLEWDGGTLDLGTPASLAEAGRALQERLKALPHSRLVEQIHRIVRELGQDPGDAIGPASPYRMLSEGAIARMAGSGIIEFGAHTHSHAILGRLSPPQQRQEIERSLVRVAELTGAPCRQFAYPNGRPGDYDAQTIRMLAEAGVREAVTSIAGSNHRGTPRMELRRYGVGADTAPEEFELATHHISGPGTRS